MSEEIKLESPTGGPSGLPPVPLFAWVRSRWFLRWHIAHLAWVASAIPLLGFAGWRAIVESDAGWNIFIFGWVAAGIWLRVDRYLEARTAEVSQELDEKLSTAEANAENTMSQDAEPEYDPLKPITCKCEVCGWIDDFTAESLNMEQCAYGFCEDCDQERIFILN